MTLQTDLQDAIARIQTDSDVFHDIVHGDDTATITTENGPVKSVAKSVKDITDQIAQAGIDLIDAVDQAEAAQSGAEQARNEAIAVSGQVKISADDTAAGTLDSKIVAGSNIVLSVQNDGGNEALVITATVPTIPDSTTEAKGIVEKATQAEMTAGAPDKFPDAEILKNHLEQVGHITTDIFISSDTWVKPEGCRYVKVTVVGGGGGRSGNGGTSSFGSHCSATGGTKPSTNSAGGGFGGTGGVGAGGDLDIGGQDGGSTHEQFNAPRYSDLAGGSGGSSILGGGGRGGVYNQSTQNGNNYGGGAGGAGANSNNTNSQGQGGAGGGGAAIKIIPADQLGETETVSVGSGGSGGGAVGIVIVEVYG